MEGNQILKQATALKKTYGYSYALDYLIGNYKSANVEDLPMLLEKIFTYFKKDTNNNHVIDFVNSLLSSNKIEQYSGMLSSFYLSLKDYESYKLTIMSQLSKVDPNKPWNYCYELHELQKLLC